MPITYRMVGQDHQEYGPYTLKEIQGFIREGRIVGSTQMIRSDRDYWSTAADFPELKVKDCVSPSGTPNAAAYVDPIYLIQEISVHEQKARSGASWFFWVGGLSMLNSVFAALGMWGGFVIGLGLPHLAGAWFGLENAAWTFALAFLAGGTGIFLGFKAVAGRFWAYLLGMVLYALDALVFLFFQDWVSLGFHAMILMIVTPGLLSTRELKRLRPMLEKQPAPASAAQPVP